MNVYILDRQKSIKNKEPHWKIVGDLENPVSRSRIAMRYLGTVMSKLIYDRGLESRRTPLICNADGCFHEFGYFWTYRWDLFLQEEIISINQNFKNGCGFFRGDKCCLPLSLLSRRCMYTRFMNLGSDMDVSIGIELDLVRSRVNDIQNGGIFIDFISKNSMRENQVYDLLSHFQIKSGNLSAGNFMCYYLNGLIMSDSFNSKLKEISGINLSEWFNIIPTWYHTIERSFNLKNSKGLGN